MPPAAHVAVAHLKEHVGELVTIKGWLYNIRSSGKLMFPEIRDGSGIVQGIVVKNQVSESVWQAFEKLTQESSVIVTGEVSKHPKLADVYELQVRDIEIVQLSKGYPITPKEHGIEFLSDHRHLWLRSKRQWAIMRIRHEVISAIRDFSILENLFWSMRQSSRLTLWKVRPHFLKWITSIWAKRT